MEKNLHVIPIEVKSAKPRSFNGLYAHQALDNLLSAHKEIKEAYVFGKGNVKQESDVLWSIPIYFVEFLRKQ